VLAVALLQNGYLEPDTGSEREHSVINVASKSTQTTSKTGVEPFVPCAFANNASAGNSTPVPDIHSIETIIDPLQIFSYYVFQARIASTHGDPDLSKRLLSNAQAILYGTDEHSVPGTV